MKIKSKPRKGEFGKKLYSVQESYWIFYNGIRTMKYMYKTKRNKELSPKFIERLMLAVTGVNVCSVCSHAHTKKALESGISNEEIQKILVEIIVDIPPEEFTAVLFAQHYADTRGNPSKESWERIVEIYGISKAKGILGSIRMIMMGNVSGMVWSSFVNRLRGKPDPRSSLRYELIMFLSIVLIPISFIHALISNLIKKPIINF